MNRRQTMVWRQMRFSTVLCEHFLRSFDGGCLCSDFHGYSHQRDHRETSRR